MRTRVIITCVVLTITACGGGDERPTVSTLPVQPGEQPTTTPFIGGARRSDGSDSTLDNRGADDDGAT